VSQAVAGSSPVVLPGSVAQRRLPLAVNQVPHTQVRVLPGPPFIGLPCTALCPSGQVPDCKSGYTGSNPVGASDGW
jgi:hypothetical protein